MEIRTLIKKLAMLKAIWGRRATVLTGLNDNGAKAAEINNPNIAKESQGRTIFNVNHLSNECGGGHYHTSDTIVDSSKVCLNFIETDWINNKIEVIASGNPTIGQIGPHGLSNTCLETQVWKDIGNDFKEVDLEVIVNKTTRNITLIKSPRPGIFSGKIMMISR